MTELPIHIVDDEESQRWVKAGLQDLYGPRLRGDQSRSELFDVVARLGQP